MIHHRHWQGRTVAAQSARAARGAMGNAAGRAAEDIVARQYEARGATVIARRWRGKSGEIDLILRHGDQHIFVEVKKSRDHATAVARITASQITRIFRAAEEFCAGLVTGLNSDMRFDAATVDSFGQVEILEGALCQ